MCTVLDSPVHDVPGIRQVPHYLYCDEHFLFDVDGSDHLVQVLPGVGQKLLHLQVTLQLMELLDLGRGVKTKGHYWSAKMHRSNHKYNL